MELILDTCGLLSLTGLAERKLTRKTLRLVEEAEFVYVSSCSLFEISIKHKKKNLSIHPFISALALWETALKEYQLIDLPVSASAFFRSTELPDHHADPFDRIILVEALSRNMPILTYDTLFERYGVEVLN